MKTADDAEHELEHILFEGLTKLGWETGRVRAAQALLKQYRNLCEEGERQRAFTAWMLDTMSPPAAWSYSNRIAGHVDFPGTFYNLEDLKRKFCE